MTTTKMKQTSRSGEVRRAVNQKFLLVAFGTLVIASVAVYFVHKLQVDRNAGVFRERAEAAREKGESSQAIADYTRYLGFRPDDTDARAELGILIQDNAKSGKSLLQAFLTYEKVLLKEEGRDDIRNRLIDVAMRLGRFTDAESQIQFLLPSAANSAELEYKLGACAEFQNKLELAEELYQKSIDHGYRKPPVFLRLGALLEGQSAGSTRAEDLVNQMVDANPESIEAILVRAKFWMDKGRFEEARKDLARAEVLDPGNTETVLLESRIPAPVDMLPDDAGQTQEEMRSKLTLAIERKPTDAQIYLRLSELELAAGNQDAAVQALRSGIAAAEKPAELLAILGDRLISQGQLSEAEEQLKQLKQLDGTAIFVDFLNARLHIAKGELPEALKLFRKVQPQMAGLPQLRELSSLYVASCFEAMGDRDEQIRELRNALAMNPEAEQTALRLAAALQANGKSDEAVGVYRPLSHLPGVPLELARLELQRTLRQPPEQRDWPKLEAMVQAAAEKPESSPAAILRSQIMFAQGRLPESVEILKKLHAEAPTEEVTGRLVAMLVSQRDLKQASEVIDEAQRKLGDTVALRIARALLIVEAKEDQADEALGKLEVGIDAFSAADQFRLFASLADLYEQRANAESADRLRNLAAKLRPYDLRTRIRLLETAVAAGHREHAAEHLQKLGDIAGPDNPQTLAAEVFVLVNSEAPSPADLDKANSLLSDVAARRPGWYRVPFMLGVLNEREGNLDRAGQKYREAIDLGDREPRDIARAMTLYSRIDRYDEMQRMMEQLRIDSPPSVRPLLRRMEAELTVAANRGDSGDAVKLLEEAVPKDSANPQEQIWVGAMYEKLRQSGNAGVAYREAVRLDSHQPDSWIALISFLNRQRQPFDSELTEAREQMKAHSNPLDFARLFEAAGQLAEAETYYKQQLAKDPQNAGAILAVTGFYQRTAQAQQAEPLLRSLLEPDRKYRQPVVLQARRSLAVILAARDYAGFQEGLALLDANLAAGGDRTNDLLAKASILAVRANPTQMRDAMLLLQELDGKQALNSQSRALLAQVCDAAGERDTANQHWQKLLGPNAQSQHLAMYVKRQLQNKDLEDVPSLLTQLQKLEPNIAAELTFRWQVQTGNAKAGIKSLAQYLAEADPSPEKQARRIYNVAELLERAGAALKQDSPERQQLLMAAETWYREILAKVPEATLSLARLLGRLGRISEALKLCDGARTAQSNSQVCGIAMQIVRQPGATPDDVAQVEQWLKDAVFSDPKSGAALVQFGEFGLFHERYQQSLDLYEQLLQRSPDNVIVLNNLAWLLSVWKGEHARAEKLIDRAIGRAGPVAALLDTRGTIHLISGNYDDAIADFRDAVAADNAPSNRFHLALACWKDKKPEATRLNFRAAIDAGFRFEDLLPIEQQAFGADVAEMQAAMDAQP